MFCDRRDDPAARLSVECKLLGAQRVFAAAIALLMITAAPLVWAAVPVVYHSPSDDGVMPPLPFVIAPGVLTTLHLYIDGGSAVSPNYPCHQGVGDELCAWDVVLDGESGLNLMDFAGAGGIVSDLNGATLRFNGGNSISGTLGPSKLGDLVVQGISGGSLELSGTSKFVDTTLTVGNLAAATLISVPEPDALPGLLSGVLLLHTLAGLHPPRRRFS